MTRRLLLADDSVTIQRVVELTFSGEDIDVVTVSDGEEAIASMSADPPDIILADIAMPKKNGYEVAAFVKGNPATAHIPVVALSANAMPRDIEKGLEAGFFSYLTKPIKVEEFMGALDVALIFAQSEVKHKTQKVPAP